MRFDSLTKVDFNGFSRGDPHSTGVHVAPKFPTLAAENLTVFSGYSCSLVRLLTSFAQICPVGHALPKLPFRSGQGRRARAAEVPSAKPCSLDPLGGAYLLISAAQDQ